METKGSGQQEKKTKRDEFACPCCGTPTDSSYCAPCDAAGCGEEHVMDTSDMCAAAQLAKGWKNFGAVVERVQMKDGDFRLCRIEVWRKPDGEVTFGRIMEVLSPAYDGEGREVSR